MASHQLPVVVTRTSRALCRRQRRVGCGLPQRRRRAARMTLPTAPTATAPMSSRHPGAAWDAGCVGEALLDGVREPDGPSADGRVDALAEVRAGARTGTRHTTLRTPSLPMRIALPSRCQVNDSPCGSNGIDTRCHWPRTDHAAQAHA